MGASGVSGPGLDLLTRWKRQLETAPAVLEKVSANMAEESIALIAEGFEKETDPYGNRWQKLLRRRGRILQDTGRLRSSWHRKRVDAGGFTIASGVKYAKYHQGGTQGRKKAHSRFQATSKRGRFLSRDRAGKVKTGAVGVRQLQFKEGGGAIPARKMIPDPGPLPEQWSQNLVAAAEEVLRDHFTERRS